MSFNTVPSNAAQKPEPFELHVEQQKLLDFQTLVRLSPIGKDAYENQEERDGKFGVSRKWMQEARNVWQNHFDWYEHTIHIRVSIPIPINTLSSSVFN
jgi:microsomal epoxide hydrolase